jgi:hypothetical protein
MRIRILFASLVAALALGAVAAPGALAASSKRDDSSSVPPLYTLPISGQAKNGKQFKGTYAIQRFVAKGNKAYAVGTLKGKLKNRRVSRSGVMMPASLAVPENGQGVQSAQAVCPVLNLVLGPIDLNLLGLRVQLGGPGPGGQLNQPIVLRITAIQGGGLLGDLLCGLTNALNQPGALAQLNQNIQQLTAALNGLLSLFGGLPATQP